MGRYRLQDLAQDRDKWKALVNTVMNLQVSLNAGKFLSSCTIGGFSRRAHLHEAVCMCAYIYIYIWGTR
jgi:hypothetical protein